jgi:hypothetical protein
VPRPKTDKTKPQKSRATGAAEADPERNADGTVREGNTNAVGGKGGRRPGRQTAAEERRYMTAFRKGLSDEDLTAIISEQVKKAKDGDTQATKLLLSYAIGKPTEQRPEGDAGKGGRVRVEFYVDTGENKAADDGG